jgi:hypothetical protein
MSTRFVTGKVRLSYAKIMRPGKNEMNGKSEYSAVVLVPKTDTDTINGLKAAAKAAIEKKFGGTPPKGLKNPLRDGDTSTKDDGSPMGAEYKGHLFFNCKTDADRNKPSVIDSNNRELIDPDSVVSGDYVRLSVNAYAYDAVGNKGVAFGLNNVLLVAKGEPLGAPRMTAADEFGIGGGNQPEPAAATTGDDWL